MHFMNVFCVKESTIINGTISVDVASRAVLCTDRPSCSLVGGGGAQYLRTGAWQDVNELRVSWA